MSERVSIGQLYPGYIPPGKKTTDNPAIEKTIDGKTFRDIFRDNIVKFSHHAEVRLQQRGIQLQPEQVGKIESAIAKAAAKGAKDSLILLNDMAFIVNVKNKTVITAMEGKTMKDNVFTQIDSAIIIS